MKLSACAHAYRYTDADMHTQRKVLILYGEGSQAPQINRTKQQQNPQTLSCFSFGGGHLLKTMQSQRS